MRRELLYFDQKAPESRFRTKATIYRKESLELKTNIENKENAVDYQNGEFNPLNTGGHFYLNSPIRIAGAI